METTEKNNGGIDKVENIPEVCLIEPFDFNPDLVI
jgi:hypothetical protein